MPGSRVSTATLVCLGQVRRVNVIAHTCAVPSGVILPIDLDLGSASDRYLQDKWDQVSLVAAVFAKLAARISSRGVEVP